MIQFWFFYERMKTIQTIKSSTCFDVIPLNNADIFFTASKDNSVHLRLEFDLIYVLKRSEDIYPFFNI